MPQTDLVVKGRYEGAEEIQRADAAVQQLKEQTAAAGQASTSAFEASVLFAGGVASAAASAVAAGAALAGMIEHLMGYSLQLQNANLQTGWNVESWQKLNRVGDELGFGFDRMRSAVERLEKNIETGGKALAKFGIEVESLKGLNPEDQFRAIATSIMGIKDPSERTAAAMAAFGKTGAELIPVLDQVASGADRFQKALSAEQVKTLADAQIALNSAKEAWDALKQSILAAIATNLPLAGWFDLIKRGIDQIPFALKAALAFDPRPLIAEQEKLAKTTEWNAAMAKVAGERAKEFAEQARQLAIAVEKGNKEIEAQAKAAEKAEKALEKYQKQLDAAADRQLKASMAAEEKELKHWASLDAAEERHTRQVMADEEKQRRAQEKHIHEVAIATEEYYKQRRKDEEDAARAEEENLQKRREDIMSAAAAMANLGQVIGGVFGAAIAEIGTGVGLFMQFADQAQKATTGLQQATVAMNALATAWKSGPLGGAMAGAGAGSMFGPIGALVGAIGGGIAGLLGGLHKEEMEVNDLRDKFIEAHGGWLALQKDIAKATNEDLLKKLFNAKTVKDYNAAMAEITKTLGLWEDANKGLDDAMKKYGITVDQLGPKFAQQHLDEMAGGLLKDYELLNAAGVDQAVIIEKMGPALDDYVNTAIKAGVDIPQAMKPTIDAMYEQGKLLHEDGTAYTEAEYQALKYGQTTTEAFKSMTEAIYALVKALGGDVPDAFQRAGDAAATQGQRMREAVPHGGGPHGPGDEDVSSMARGGIVGHNVLPFVPRADRGMLTRPGGAQMVVAHSGEVVAPVRALFEQVGRAAAAAAGGGTVHVHVMLDGKEVGDAVVRRAQAGLFAIPPSAVRNR
jgi:chemotaxis protein histidine kinase CheA